MDNSKYLLLKRYYTVLTKYAAKRATELNNNNKNWLLQSPNINIHIYIRKALRREHSNTNRYTSSNWTNNNHVQIVHGLIRYKYWGDHNRFVSSRLSLHGAAEYNYWLLGLPPATHLDIAAYTSGKFCKTTNDDRHKYKMWLPQHNMVKWRLYILLLTWFVTTTLKLF